MKILLFKIGALGDLLMATPLVRQLRRRFPSARIDFLAGRSFAGVFARNPHLDGVVEFPEELFFRRDLRGYVRLVGRIRKARYDTAFVLDRHWVFPLTAFLFGAARRVGFDRMGREGVLLTDRVRFEAVRHEVHYNLDLLAAVDTAAYDDASMEIFPSGEDVAFAERLYREPGLAGKPVVALAPGGGANPGQDMPAKRWPVARYVELARLLMAAGYGVLLVGGRTDETLARTILAEAGGVSGVGATLGGSAELFRRSHAAVCSDGGPMHLASAVGARVVSLFGPTDPRRLAPLNGYACLWKPVSGEPCYDIFGRLGREEEALESMRRITPGEVLAIIEERRRPAKAVEGPGPGEG